MSNKCLYIISVLFSLVLVILGAILEGKIAAVFSNVGCSGIAASVMALFLERISEKNRKLHLVNARSLYLRRLNDQLNMMLERILWFDARLNDLRFDWVLLPGRVVRE